MGAEQSREYHGNNLRRLHLMDDTARNENNGEEEAEQRWWIQWTLVHGAGEAEWGRARIGRG